MKIIPRDVLLLQLEELKYYDFPCEDSNSKIKNNPWIEKLIQEFDIPEDLEGAFVEYALEFLQNPQGCINFNSNFWGDEDLAQDIINKCYCFFHPIAEYVYPNSTIRTIIEPSHQGKSTICILKDHTCIYFEYKKVWHLWCEPQELFAVLAQLALSMS